MKSSIYRLCTFGLLLIGFCSDAFGQDTLTRHTPAIGGRWFSSGKFSSFITAGQLGAETHLGSDSTAWSGSVGFLVPVFEIGKNQPPVAVASRFFIQQDINFPILLEGFDPEGDSIIFEIVTAPNTGTLTPIAGTLSEFDFSPNTGLSPDAVYRDSLVFRVKEVNGRKQSSATAKYKFSYQYPDVDHDITGVGFAGTTLSVDWVDLVPNANYGVEVLYYDLSNVNTAGFRPLYNQTSAASAFNPTDGNFTLDIEVSQSAHPYVFAGSRVLVTVVITTANGASDFESYVIDNGTGGRVDASEDGLFFAFASNMTVAENKQVALNLVAVELGTFDLTNATLEIIKGAGQGNISIPGVKQLSTNTKTWLLNYTSTKQVGGMDSIQFRVYNPERQLFDTAWARVTIQDVNDPPTIKRLADQRTNESVPLILDLEYNDPDSEVDILVESNETSRVPVSYAGGKITVSPDEEFSGKVSINVIITERSTAESYVAFDRFDVTVVAVNDPPKLAAVNDQTIDEDTQVTLVLSATDPDALLPVFEYSAVANDPSKFTITIEDNNVTIIPNRNVNGTYTVDLYADDRLGTLTSKSLPETVKLVINPVNDAPEIVKAIPSQKIVVGLTSYTINLKGYFTDVESPESLVYSASGNTNLTFTFSNGIMTVTQNGNFSGVEDIIISASDGELSVAQNVAFVAVANSVNIVEANPINLVSLEEDFGTYTIDASDVFNDQNNANAKFNFELIGGDFLSVSIDSVSGIITVVSQAEYSGKESFFLIGTTSGQSSYSKFDIEVSAVNDAPVIKAPNLVVAQEDVPRTNIFIEASDVDNSIADLSIEVKSSDEAILPATSITTDKVDNGFFLSFQALADKYGDVTLTLTLSDAALSVDASIAVEIQAINDAPTQQLMALDPTQEDKSYFLDITEIFSDIEGDELTLTVDQMPDWAKLEDGLILGTPNNEDVGVWVITVSADDGNAGTLTASFQLEVQNVNDAPTLLAELDDITVFQENQWTFNFPTSIFTDVDAGDVLTYSFETIPTWATVDGSSVKGTPRYEDLGSYDLVVKATDKDGLSVSNATKVEVAFTLYPAVVEVSFPDQCASGKYDVQATGAINYKWYDVDEKLIASDVDKLSLEAGVYYVEGVDSEGRATPEKVEFELAKCLVLATDEEQITLYPNPAHEVLNLTNVIGASNIKVFDALGRKYDLGQTASEKLIKIDISTLSDGMYFLKYEQNGQTSVKKFVKSK